MAQGHMPAIKKNCAMNNHTSVLSAFIGVERVVVFDSGAYSIQLALFSWEA